MARPLKHTAGLVGILFAILAGGSIASLSTTACLEARYPSCKTNADCTSRDAGVLGPICYNLRCVECQYDTDCPEGQACSNDQRCAELGSGKEWAPVVMTPKNRPTAEPTGAAKADSFEECAKACKDKACVDQCNKKFGEQE